MYPPLPRKKELRQRRTQLRQRRRWRAVKICWQILVLGVLVSGLVWAARQPDWIIRQPQQIQISGNRYLKAETVRTMLGLKYPVSLLHLQPQHLNASLRQQGNIQAATIHRALLPPRLTIQVQDQAPVAIADQDDQPGLVNASGYWLPTASYQINPEKLPRLKLLAANNGLCHNWSGIYQSLQHSPVPVSEVDCRDALNLFVKTEIGNLRIGAFEPARFRQQLQKAYELGDWQQLYQTKYQQAADIAYIDLENPEFPKIQQATVPTAQKTKDQNDQTDSSANVR